MSITNEEHSSIESLVEESNETKEIAEKLHQYLQGRRNSTDKMEALRLELLGDQQAPTGSDGNGGT